MTNTRLVLFGYIALALAAGFFLEHVALAAFGSFGPTQPLTRPLAGDWTWCTVIGLAVVAAAALYLWFTPKTHEVSLEIAAELRKVSWPSWAETRAATIAVIVASIIAALLLGMFDVFWQFLTDKIQNPTL
ncbi:MAG: preprotein translocase subunit SecE [Myxococcales bacterium]